MKNRDHFLQVSHRPVTIRVIGNLEVQRANVNDHAHVPEVKGVIDLVQVLEIDTDTIKDTRVGVGVEVEIEIETETGAEIEVDLEVKKGLEIEV